MVGSGEIGRLLYLRGLGAATRQRPTSAASPAALVGFSPWPAPDAISQLRRGDRRAKLPAPLIPGTPPAACTADIPEAGRPAFR